MRWIPTVALIAYIAALASSLILPCRLRNVRRRKSFSWRSMSTPLTPNCRDAANEVQISLLQSLEKSYLTTDVPMNIFKAKEPYKAQIISVKSLTVQNRLGEICEVVVNHGGNIPYLEGQSFGIIPPGINLKNGRPHLLRLYSLASTRYGDDMKGKTASLCVSRSLFVDESGNEHPDKKGICSNFLCDAKPGDEVLLTGPAGKVLLMPEKSPKSDIIMVATGTGVAPFRGFLRRLFVENTPAAAAFEGLAWLFLGVPDMDSRLYHHEWQDILQKNPTQFRLDYALSREETNEFGGRRYVQDCVAQHADEILTRMSAGAHFYVCGLRAMLPGIISVFEKACARNGLVWSDILKLWKELGQWHVEVY